MNNKVLYPGATIGIIGAGQLGKMLGQAALSQGYKVAMYDPNPQACGFATCHWYQIASFDDQAALMAFADKVHVLTYEFENINGQVLQALADKAPLVQGTDLLLTSQDRVKEKGRIKSLGLPVVDYLPVLNIDQVKASLDQVGLPCLLKTTRLGYDGKGQYLIKQASDLDQDSDKIQALLNQPCILEAHCPYVKEVSVMVVRDRLGQVKTFPIAQNQHLGGILYTSQAPARISKAVQDQVLTYAHKIADHFDLIGLCGIECFVTADDKVYINELAPRPHNSGHYSIEACQLSQYHAHILAICGRRLPDIQKSQPALMVNILGQHLKDWDWLDQFFDFQIHLYDKGQALEGRKMGHMTKVYDHEEDLAADLASDRLQAWKELFKQ